MVTAKGCCEATRAGLTTCMGKNRGPNDPEIDQAHGHQQALLPPRRSECLVWHLAASQKAPGRTGIAIVFRHHLLAPANHWGPLRLYVIHQISSNEMLEFNQQSNKANASGSPPVSPQREWWMGGHRKEAHPLPELPAWRHEQNEHHRNHDHHNHDHCAGASNAQAFWNLPF